MTNLQLAIRARLNHFASPVAVPSVVQTATGSGSDNAPSCTLPGGAPTPGHYLIFLLYAADPVTAIPAGFTEFSACNAGGNGRYQRVYYRQVQAGDSATVAMTIASATYHVEHLYEIKDVTSGLSCGVGSYTSGNPSPVIIPAGVSGALPIVINGSSNQGYTRTYNTPAGFTLIREVANSNHVALVGFAGAAASTGAAITASLVGYTSGSHDYQTAGGFLIK